MPLTAEERERFLASLRTDEAFREELRRELLTTELLSLPQRFAAFVDEVHAFVDEVHAFVEATDRRFNALERDMGQLKGLSLEHKIRANPGYYLYRYLRKARVVGLDELLQWLGAEDLDDDEYSALAQSDLFVRGTLPQDGRPVLVVVEATWRARSGDIDRQVAKLDILARHGAQALAVVVAMEPPSPSVAHLAKNRGVVLQHDAANAA
ncbi:MAG: hypothetical protein ACP5VR_01450 [Acidimicrobiales bacterium]